MKLGRERRLFRAAPETVRPAGDTWLQCALVAASAAAIWLVAQPQPLQGWGYVAGLASQPLWFLATWRARQWGMFALSIFYTGAWAQGLANHLHF